jgi:hypothetical protein
MRDSAARAVTEEAIRAAVGPGLARTKRLEALRTERALRSEKKRSRPSDQSPAGRARGRAWRMSKELPRVAAYRAKYGIVLDETMWATAVADMLYWCHGPNVLAPQEDGNPHEKVSAARTTYEIGEEAMALALIALRDVAARKGKSYRAITPAIVGEMLDITMDEIQACRLTTVWANGEAAEDVAARRKRAKAARHKAYMRESRARKRTPTAAAIEASFAAESAVMTFRDADLSLRKIATAMNFFSVPHPKNKPWNRESVKKLINAITAPSRVLARRGQPSENM